METITTVASTVASTVSKTIWGDQSTQKPTTGNETAGQEPISGEQGKGTVTDPYDKGNADKSATDGITSQPSTKTDEAPISDRKEAMDSVSPNTNNASNAGATDPLQTTDKTGASGALSNPTKGSDVIPSESQHPGVAPTSGGVTQQKQQGADRPSDAPDANQASAITGKKDEAEATLQKHDPNDHSGEPLKMHSGDSTNANEWENRRDSKAGNLGGKEHGKEQGTGDEWVKTSGLAADGGNFDATKPGAGKEANRLFEEKGLSKSAPGEPSQSTGAGSFENQSPTSGGSGGKEKIPLREKVKQKLHIHSHKHD